MVRMNTHTRRRWGIGLVAALVAFGAGGFTPVAAQSVPIILPPITPIVAGIPVSIPPIFAGGTEHSQGGVTWSTTGRADVDVDIDRHHGQAAAR
jgi:hypothetical protein